MSLHDVAGSQRDRLPPIPADLWTDAQKAAVAEFEALRRAPPFGPFIPLLRSPELMTRTSALGEYLRYRSALPARLSEFVILITAAVWKQQFEWRVHVPIATSAGVNAEAVEAIAEGRRPRLMSQEEEILYDFCLELQLQHSVTDATYNRALEKFGERGVVDTLGICGYYTMLAMVLNTAHTPAPATEPEDAS